MNVLETKGLSKSFGALTVIQDVNIRFATNLRYALIGPNGAGKTTFFNLLSGEMAPSSGRVLLGERDVTGLSCDARARAGVARSFQRNNLFPDLTVGGSLAIACAVRMGITHVFWRRLAGLRRVRERAEEIAAMVGLADAAHVMVRHLSYGSQRQLEVGLALATEPTLLLLDEPTAGMGPEETASMQSLIEGLPRRLTAVIIEHDMDVVAAFADRVVVLDYGRVLAEGTLAEIRDSPVVRDRYLGNADDEDSE